MLRKKTNSHLFRKHYLGVKGRRTHTISRTSTSLERSMSDHEQTTAINFTEEQLLQDEVEALRAIFGDDKISYHPRRSPTTPAIVSVSLASLLHDQPHPSGSDITLSAFLPDGYPGSAPPKTPTLRADALSSAMCSKLVQRMLQQQHATPGGVCLFEYCEAMISVLNEFGDEIADTTLEAGGPSSTNGAADEFAFEERNVIFHGEPLMDRKSVFQAHVAHVTCMEDVDGALKQLKGTNRKIATATHNTLAYRIEGVNSSELLQDADDDGEKGAGKCVLYVLQQMEAVNVLCVVSRWFGGIKLGPIRFKHISKAARDLTEKYIAEFQGCGSASR